MRSLRKSRIQRRTAENGAGIESDSPAPFSPIIPAFPRHSAFLPIVRSRLSPPSFRFSPYRSFPPFSPVIPAFLPHRSRLSHSSFPPFSPRHSRESGNPEVCVKPRPLSDSGLAGFTGFRFAQPAPFAITEKPANPNTSKRLPNPENPIILQILILTKPRTISPYPHSTESSTIALH